MKKMKGIGLCVLMLWLWISRGGISYGATWEDPVKGSSDDPVDIQVVILEGEELAETSQKEQGWLPGDTLIRIPRIMNCGRDCYVRATLQFRVGSAFVTEKLEDILLLDMDPNWKKAEDGYFYYSKILKTGEHVDWFRGIVLPVELSQKAWENVSVQMLVRVEGMAEGEDAWEEQEEAWSTPTILPGAETGDRADPWRKMVWMGAAMVVGIVSVSRCKRGQKKNGSKDK